jgi:hypothetical protein
VTNAVDGSSTYAPTPGTVSRRIGGETVLVDLDGELYFSLNRTGSVAWQELSSGRSFQATVASLVESFEVEESEAEADLALLIGQLIDAKLLESR